MNKSRLEAFSDGVFAIAITLLILNVKIPQANEVPEHVLHHVFKSAIPKLIGFGFSFLVIGVFWVSHHRIFAFAKIIDSNLLWMNIVYLMFVAVIPFPAGLLAENPFASETIIIYSATLFVIALMHFVLFEYVIRNEHIRHHEFTRDVYLSAQKTAIVGPVCYVLAGVASPFIPYLSYAFIIGAMLFYIFFSGQNKVSQELLEISKKEAEEK